MPEFSIIVPIYKVEKYLEICIDSIIGQSFCNFELILVDDGSPDTCGEICDRYSSSDTRVKVVHKENGGLSSARNAGLDIATGKYVIFIDSDDFWDDASALEHIHINLIVNVVGSSIAREADKVFYTLAGPEISVATTKAYSAQLAAMYCLAVQFAKVRGKITDEQYSYYISELQTIPEKIQKILEDKERIQWFAAKYANAHDVFFVGRGIDYAVSLEGSLKLKEISYIHSEAYAAGELKHGTISLIEQGTLVIGVLTQSELYEKTVSNMLECKSRGAYLMGLTTYGKYEIEDQVNFTVYVPKVDEHFIGSLTVIPLQLLGYYVSVAKGLDVDKPRNLAKSVTVE